MLKQSFHTLSLIGLLGACSTTNAESVQSAEQPLDESRFSSITQSFPGGGTPGNVALLTDGRILFSGPSTSTHWWTLTPDSTGSYINGTWSQVGDSTYGRYDNPSFVLRNGAYWICGGEYSTGGSGHVCEIFDPVLNAWGVAASTIDAFGDTPAAEAADGSIYAFARYNTDTQKFDGSAWTTVAAWSAAKQSTEGGSLLLPDGSILFGDHQFQRYVPSSDQWIDTGSTPGNSIDEYTDSSGHYEIGAFLQLIDGRVLVLGGNSHNGLYCPPPGYGCASPDTWQPAQETPAGYAGYHADTPATVEPDGTVLAVNTSDLDGTGTTSFWEYSPTFDTWTQAADDTWAQAHFPAGGAVRMLNLPNTDFTNHVGQVMLTGKSGSVWVYRAQATVTAIAPAVSQILTPFIGRYRVLGTNLNGATTGADFGDDGKFATNYPIVTLRDANGAVTFGFSFDFDSMTPRPGVGAPALADGFSFRIPNSIANGSYTVDVSASGIAAPSTTLSVSSDRGWEYVANL